MSCWSCLLHLWLPRINSKESNITNYIWICFIWYSSKVLASHKYIESQINTSPFWSWWWAMIKDEKEFQNLWNTLTDVQNLHWFWRTVVIWSVDICSESYHHGNRVTLKISTALGPNSLLTKEPSSYSFGLSKNLDARSEYPGWYDFAGAWEKGCKKIPPVILGN